MTAPMTLDHPAAPSPANLYALSRFARGLPVKRAIVDRLCEVGLLHRFAGRGPLKMTAEGTHVWSTMLTGPNAITLVEEGADVECIHCGDIFASFGILPLCRHCSAVHDAAAPTRAARYAKRA